MKPEPLLLNFETDTTCNAACTFCQHPHMQRSGRASWSQLLNILYWHAPHAREINPFGMQEPTLDPRLPALLANCKQFNRHAHTVLYSNMSHYDEAMWRHIIRGNLLDDLHVSFYGVHKRIYNKLQPNLDFHEVQENIKQVMKLRHRMRWRKPQVHMHLIALPETYRHAAKFLEQWSRIVDDAGVMHYDAWCGKNPYNPAFEAKLWGPPAVTRTPCPRLWGALTIHADGNVVPCCLDYDDRMVLGNIHADRHAFTNDAFTALRQLHVEGKQEEIALCRECSLWRYEHPKEWNTYWQQHAPAITVTAH